MLTWPIGGPPMGRFWLGMGATALVASQLPWLVRRLSKAQGVIFTLHRVLPDDPARLASALRAAADSNCLIVLPEGVADYAPGSLVEVVPYAGGLGGG